MKKKLFLSCFLFAILAYVPSASAITFDLNTPFGPSGAGTSVQPALLTAAFGDVAEGVQLKLSAAGLQDKSYVTQWYFNVLPPTELEPPLQQGQLTDPRLQPPFLLSPNKLDAGAPGATLGAGFDFLMAFSETGDLFESKETATFLFDKRDYPKGITAEFFNQLNTAGAFYAAAKILKSGEAGESWIASGPVTTPNPVPEPGTMLLFGFGLIGLAFSGGRNLLK